LGFGLHLLASRAARRYGSAIYCARKARLLCELTFAQVEVSGLPLMPQVSLSPLDVTPATTQASPRFTAKGPPDSPTQGLLPVPA